MLLQDTSAVYLALRAGGSLLASVWTRPDRLEEALADWVARASSSHRHTLEMTLLGRPRRLDDNGLRCLADQERGLWGFAAATDTTASRLSPNEIITRNLSHAKALHRLSAPPGVSGAGVYACATEQWLWAYHPHPRWLQLERQKAAAGTRPADTEGVATLGDGLAIWLYSQLDQHGRLPYKYWPGNGRYAQTNNTIRQYLATLALLKHARTLGGEHQRAKAEMRLQKELAATYVVHDGYAAISDKNGIKLGAIALAGLALLHSRRSHRWRREWERLYAATRRLWTPSGAFRTFMAPSWRNDNQNFYPGEALLFWAELYRRECDPRLRRDLDRALSYYRRWHLDNPNPAFVPWHTQVCARMYAATGGRGYLDHIIAMNDWLLPLQQWDNAPYPDMRGRFHDPRRPDFGPPHASSTAVYTEGLIAAAGAARAAGDTAHAVLYARAARRGLSHLRQLQYLDVTDLFRLSHPERVFGALRTEVYDLTVRVDSVAHALLACLAWRTARLP